MMSTRVIIVFTVLIVAIILIGLYFYLISPKNYFEACQNICKTENLRYYSWETVKNLDKNETKVICHCMGKDIEMNIVQGWPL